MVSKPFKHQINAEGKILKTDWKCICGGVNYERNEECKFCKLNKDDGLVEEIPVTLGKKNKEKINEPPKAIETSKDHSSDSSVATPVDGQDLDN